MIEHIHSVAIFVTDLDAALSFYRDVLGLEISKQGSFGAEFFLEPTHIGVHPAEHSDAKAMVGRHTGVTFRVAELLSYCEDLHRKGVRFVTEPTRMAWGVMALIADPENNILALWEPILDRDRG